MGSVVEGGSSWPPGLWQLSSCHLRLSTFEFLKKTDGVNKQFLEDPPGTAHPTTAACPYPKCLSPTLTKPKVFQFPQNTAETLLEKRDWRKDVMNTTISDHHQKKKYGDKGHVFQRPTQKSFQNEKRERMLKCTIVATAVFLWK